MAFAAFLYSPLPPFKKVFYDKEEFDLALQNGWRDFPFPQESIDAAVALSTPPKQVPQFGVEENVPKDPVKRLRLAIDPNTRQAYEVADETEIQSPLPKETGIKLATEPPPPLEEKHFETNIEVSEEELEKLTAPEPLKQPPALENTATPTAVPQEQTVAPIVITKGKPKAEDLI